MTTNAFNLIKSHLESCLPDTLTGGFTMHGAIMPNAQRAEIVPETTRPGMVFDMVLRCYVTLNDESQMIVNFCEVK